VTQGVENFASFPSFIIVAFFVLIDAAKQSELKYREMVRLPYQTKSLCLLFIIGAYKV
jgi:hypothetical protein